jgi:hypothetical protein
MPAGSVFLFVQAVKKRSPPANPAIILIFMGKVFIGQSTGKLKKDIAPMT